MARLAIPARGGLMFRRILVPVDYSEHSRASVRAAAELAKPLGATVDIVHVWDRPTYVADGVMVRRQGEEHRSLSDLIRENAETEMNEFLATLELPEGVTVTHRMCSGEPAQRLVEEAKSGGYDLIVVGTHGRAGVLHLLLGSTAERLIRLSPVPVLVVPPKSRRTGSEG
jgi:nucleotide-binding universal stress UspA family protein